MRRQLSWVLARELALPNGTAAVTVVLHTAHVCVSRLYLGVHSAGAGGGRLQVAASDARAGLSRRPLEGSRRSSGGRPRHGMSAPPVRAGAGSGASGAGAKHMAVGASRGGFGRLHPPRPGCACVFGVIRGPRGSLRVSCGDFPDYKDGLSGQLGHFCKVPRIFSSLYSQHPDC